MKKFYLLFAVTTLFITGCGDSSVHPESSDNQTTKPLIITSFYPLAYMTERIAGDAAEVVNLAGASDVHDYELSPQDRVQLSNADLIIFQGAALEPWAEDLIPQLKKKGIATLEVSEKLPLAKQQAHKDEHADNEEKDEHHEDEHHEDEDHKAHNHGQFDPHTWLDPVLAQTMVEQITQALISVDEAQVEIYQVNAQTLKNQFAELDEAFSTNLAQCANREVIVSHDALGYLARRYNFTTHAIAGLSTQDEPSAQTLAALKDEAEEGITHILVEANTVQRFAQTLARETGLAMLPINPLGQGTLNADLNFISVMKANLQSLKTALSCTP